MAQKDFPIIRISALANKRANELVEAFRAQGIETSKAQLVSELILVTPIPQPQATEKKRRVRRAESSAQAAAL